MRRTVLWSATAGLAAFAVLLLWRGFFWQHAALIGLAVTALVYSSVRTFERLRRLYR